PSSGDCSRTRTLQQAPQPLQLPRSSIAGDPSAAPPRSSTGLASLHAAGSLLHREGTIQLEQPLEPLSQVVDPVRDPREGPREERPQVVALAVADHAEGHLARGTEAAVSERV